VHGVSSGDSDDKKTPSERPSAVVFMTIADTTWRMFIPSIGLTLLGVWCDQRWHTTPWLMFAGIILGMIVAALAVWLQYKKLI
jgi:F0F1-type ATP synthase assembly protein I